MSGDAAKHARLDQYGMSLSVPIPDEVCEALKLPPRCAEAELRKDLAI
jgi:hypothetical protein